MGNRYIFSSESVGEGHPDKVADTISDAVLDACLAQDKFSRVACETYVKSNMVIVGGEITTKAKLDFVQIARDAIREIGYVNDDDVFHADKVFVNVLVTQQSADIAMGVSRGSDEAQGAGDQGLMFGYAIGDTPELMPLPIALAHRLARRLTEVRKSGVVDYLRPDGKTQVTVQYDGFTPVRLDTVVLSTQHADGIDLEGTLAPDIREKVVNTVLGDLAHGSMDTSDYRLLVNPTGKFVLGGPMGDAGLTGRKIIVDTYGGWARHGGGAFSGKDPSKVDRSAAYAMRWVAKNAVAAGLADRLEVQVAYAIGRAAPVGLYVETFGTGHASDEAITRAITSVFDLRPKAIIDALDLLRPIYAKTAAYGHFGRELPEFTWERTDRVDELRAAAGL